MNWLLFNIGCIECGVSSNIVGVFDNKEQADILAEKLNVSHRWRGSGQNSFEVFELTAVGKINHEYLEEIIE